MRDESHSVVSLGRGLALALLCWCVLTGSVSAGAIGPENHAGDESLVTASTIGGSDARYSWTAQQDPAEVMQAEPDADVTVTRIRVHENGSARWSLTIRTRLENDADVESYEAFQSEFEANRSTYLSEFRDRMTTVVDNAEATTGRTMTATAFEAETGIQEVPRRWGFVRYEFTWEGVAQSGEDELVLGDVFQGGLFLEADDVLVIEPPDGYDSAEVDPAPDSTDDDQLRWDGSASFDDQRPQVRFVPADEQSTGGTSGDSSGTGGLFDGLGGPLAIALLLVVLLAAAGGIVALRDDGDGPMSTAVESGNDEPTDHSQDDVKPKADAEDPSDGSDPLDLGDLATDQDRVRALLEAEGGRIKQADIGDRLDWSDSKTSRVLSEMESDGDIEKLRIGRENVVDLIEDDGETGGSEGGAEAGT